jgi:hypothetical protein
LPGQAAERDPNLVCIPPEAFRLILDTRLAMHEDLRTSRRCRVVFDALAAGLVCCIKPRPDTTPRGRDLPH